MWKFWIVSALVLAVLALRLASFGCEQLVTDSGGDEVAEAWVARYDGQIEDDDGALALALDGLGNIHVTGYSWGDDSSSDFATIKYDTKGGQLWVARYDGPASDDDRALDLALDTSGNIYVTGWGLGNGTEADYATIKYDGGGSQLWVERYDGPVGSYDKACALGVDYLANVYVTGWSEGNGTEADYATIKYDTDGNRLWVARYDGPTSGKDESHAIAVDGWANVYGTGSSQGNGTEADYATIMYDSDGNQFWVARYDGPVSGEDNAQAVAVDDLCNVYVTGWSQGDGTEADYATVKYDNNGNQLWAARYDGPVSGEDSAHAIAIDSWGNVYVTGWSQGKGTDVDYATVKYDDHGKQLWVARYDGPACGEDNARTIGLDGWGNVYVSGWSDGTGSRYDYATVKYDAGGNRVWVARYNGATNGPDKACGMALDILGNVYVTGRSSGEGTFYDYTTVKYTQ